MLINQSLRYTILVFCIQSKNLMVDKTGLDEPKVEEMAVDEIAIDEIAVDKPGPHLPLQIRDQE